MSEILVAALFVVGIVIWAIARSSGGSGGSGNDGEASRLDVMDDMVLHDEVNAPDDLDVLA